MRKSGFRHIIYCMALLLLLASVPSEECFAQKRNTTTKTSTSKRKTTTSKRKTTATQKIDKKTQLKNEQAATQQKRRSSQQQVQVINRNIKANLDSVLILDNNIARQQRQIDSLNREVHSLNVQIDTLSARILRLNKELADKKKKYAKAMVYLQRHKTVQQKLLFIFSAENFGQIIRRMRYIKEYSSYQKAQGEMIKQKETEVKKMQQQMVASKAKVEANLALVRRKQQILEANKKNCQNKVVYLNKNLGVVQNQIKQLQKKEADLSAQIDRLIQQEIAEAKRKAEEAKRKAEEEARRAEQIRIEKEKRLAELKARQEAELKAKKEAEAKAKAAADAASKAAAKAEAEQAAANAKAVKKEIKTAEKEVAAAKKVEKEAESQPKPMMEAYKQSTEAEAKLSSDFVSNKGKLPMPITGSYSIVGHYGTYNVSGLKNVTLDNKGIDIRGNANSMARSVFNGEVSSVFQYGASYIVMVRHGGYISVYSGLSSVSVSKGSKVNTSQTLGKVGTDAEGHYTLHFQLRKGSARLNPEQWIR